MNPPTHSPPFKDDDTRQRLINAAAHLFAHNGFTSTSIREITDRANCNVASINYYFGNKESLYCEVFRYFLGPITDLRIQAIQNTKIIRGDIQSLENLITAFALAFLNPIYELEQKSTFSLLHLIMREMQEPHLPQGMLFEEVMAPVRNAMHRALTTLCPEMNQIQMDLCVHSLVGQLTHSLKMKDFLVHAVSAEQLELFDVNHLIEHIVKFSTAGFSIYMQLDTKSVSESTGEM